MKQREKVHEELMHKLFKKNHPYASLERSDHEEHDNEDFMPVVQISSRHQLGYFRLILQVSSFFLKVWFIDRQFLKTPKKIQNCKTTLHSMAKIPLKSARFGLVRILPKLEGQ